MKKLRYPHHLALLAPLAALVTGAIVMHQSAISPLLYGQNLISYLVAGLLLLFLAARPASARPGRGFVLAMLAVGCLALAGTFLDPGLENVHRWLAMGPLRLSVASLVLPSMVMGLGILLRENAVALSMAIAALTAVLLVLQPDASQLSAFGVAVCFLVWRQGKPSFGTYGVALLCLAAIGYSWLHIDALPPVAHVEGILQMAAHMGRAWFWLGMVSLALLPVPFVAFSQKSAAAQAVGLYYLVVLVSTFFGNFPVPFMGFGISPILGYSLALFFLQRDRPQES